MLLFLKQSYLQQCLPVYDTCKKKMANDNSLQKQINIKTFIILWWI